MFMLCASWLVVGLCVFPFEFSDQGVVFGRGSSECWLTCVFVLVCVAARFVLVYLDCLWDHWFVPQSPAVCQICVQQISAGVCLLNCLAAKDRGMYVCKCMCTAQ